MKDAWIQAIADGFQRNLPVEQGPGEPETAPLPDAAREEPPEAALGEDLPLVAPEHTLHATGADASRDPGVHAALALLAMSSGQPESPVFTPDHEQPPLPQTAVSPAATAALHSVDIHAFAAVKR